METSGIKATSEDVVMVYFIDYIKRLEADLKEAQGQRQTCYESEECGKLYEALAKAQGEMSNAKEDKENSHFRSKYAGLSSFIAGAKGPLSKNGLSVIQRLLPAPGGTHYLYSRLGHTSGQWIESRVLVNPIKKDIQAFGSEITYLKKYSYSSLIGIAGGEDDDDGEGAMNRKSEAPKSSKISKAQLQLLGEELRGEEDLLEEVLKVAKIGKLSDLPEGRYQKVIKWVRESKDNSKDD